MVLSFSIGSLSQHHWRKSIKQNHFRDSMQLFTAPPSPGEMQMGNIQNLCFLQWTGFRGHFQYKYYNIMCFYGRQKRHGHGWTCLLYQHNLLVWCRVGIFARLRVIDPLFFFSERTRFNLKLTITRSLGRTCIHNGVKISHAKFLTMFHFVLQIIKI